MINIERLYKHMEALGQFGKQADGGVTRFPYTTEDEQAKEFIIHIMKEAGLQVRVDAVGNLIGTMKGKSRQKLLCGSHYDTVRNGGNFDGCLGILSAIEVLHTMNEQGVIPGCDIEVIAFKNEEGNRFTSIMTGSRAICNKLHDEDLMALDHQQVTLQDAARQFHYPIEDYRSCAYDFQYVKGYLELHIEQGSVLDSLDLPVGIVKGIAGFRRYWITIHGVSGHSGAVPMQGRVDPVTAFSSLSLWIDRHIRKYEDAVATIGEIHTYPGSCNVICDHLTFSLDVRSLSMQDILDFMEETKEKVHELENAGYIIEIEETQVLLPAPCDKHMIKHIEKAIKQEQIPIHTLMSGAGHDAMNFFGCCPMGMIFVRSEHGFSHRPEEFTSKEDCEKAADVLYRTLVNLSFENL